MSVPPLNSWNSPLRTACPNELSLEIPISWDTTNDDFEGSRECELRLCFGAASSSLCGGDTNRGFVTSTGNVSGVCLLVSVEDMKELPNLDIGELPRKPKLGDGIGTLPNRSMDCLKH